MLTAGQMFGNYRIVRKIGVGGMGSVYLAEHPAIGKQVALKVIHRELAANKEVITRFFNEAKAANQIGNEHIVNIHDFGQTDDGERFYIMEYLEGRTLAEVLAAAPTLNPQRVLHIVAQMASGLHAAHSASIIHRDLKPDNVILVHRLGDADFVKILDFGLAKVLDAEQKLTAVGVVLGTPQYMSPEACESRRDIDHRADVYSLGILMFQMLCGRVPFQGETMGEVLIRQVTKLPPAPRGFNPSIPPSVEQIVLRCLAKDRNHRFANMLELRTAALAPEKYLASSPPVVRSSGEEPVAAKPRSTHFFGGGAPENRPGMAPPQAAVGIGAAPIGKTAFLGSEAPEPQGLIETLPPGQQATMMAPDDGAHVDVTIPPADVTIPPAHMLKTQYQPDAGEAAAAPHAVKTAFMAAEAPGAPPPADRGKRESVKTAFMAPGSASGAPPPAAAGAQVGSSAKTAFMSADGAGAPPPASVAATQFIADGADLGTPPMAPPGLSPPTPAHNRTMAMAPPPGYKEHPPSSGVSAVWIGVGMTLAVSGFVVLGFVWPGFLAAKSDSEALALEEPDAAVLAALPPDAQPIEKPVDAAPPPVKVARIELISEPPGAAVLNGSGDVLLEKTPGTIELPIGEASLELVFRHPASKEGRATVVPSGDARVRLELAPKKHKSKGKRRGGKGRKPKDKDATLKPKFE